MAEQSMLRQQYLAISQGKESFDNYTSRFLGQKNLGALHWDFLRMLHFVFVLLQGKRVP